MMMIINRAVEVYFSKKKRRSRSCDPKSTKKQKMDDDTSFTSHSEDEAQSSCNEVLFDEGSASHESDSTDAEFLSDEDSISLVNDSD